VSLSHSNTRPERASGACTLENPFLSANNETSAQGHLGVGDVTDEIE
jgi:hypothetical protein